MHLKKTLKYVPPVLSFFLIFQIILNKYDPDIFPQNYISNTRFQTDAGREISLAKGYSAQGDLSVAEKHLYNSLRSSPLIPLSYIELSKIYIEDGNRNKAKIALKRSFELSSHSYDNLWQISILALRSGNDELARRSLEKTADVFPKKSFHLAWYALNDRDFIMNNMVDNTNTTDYLRFLMSEGEATESLNLWKRMKKNSVEVSYRLFFGYVEFMTRNNMGNIAFDIWTERMGKPAPGLVWNGGFEREITGRGFDWEIRDGDGFSISYDRKVKVEGDYSLKIVFNGEENPVFRQVSKLVPVKEGKDYLFTSMLKTNQLTSDRGIFWSIDCYPSGGLNIRVPSYDGYTGTNGWFESSASFHTPENNCSSVKICLTRMKSNKLNRFISGTVWVDKVDVRDIKLN